MADDDDAKDDEKKQSPDHYTDVYLRSSHFKIIHVSNLDQYSPTEEYLKQCLELTNKKYTLYTLPDRSQLADTIFDEYDVILLSVWSQIDEEKLGNLLANAVDAGKQVVILLFSNTASYTHPKGRFLSEGYSATTRVQCQSVNIALGTVHKPNHPIMSNVKQLTFGSEKRMSMGQIPTTWQNSVHRIADWNDGNVCIAIRHNRPGLITEITGSFGVNGVQSDAQQLLNNALRLTKLTSTALRCPARLIRILEESNFHILHQIQQQFGDEDLKALQQNTGFKGWDAVYDDISAQLAKALKKAFKNVSGQIQNGTQQQIEAVEKQKNLILSKMAERKKEDEELGLPTELIEENLSRLDKYAQTLQSKIDKWKDVKNNTDKLISSASKK
mmetsp:Transcript_20183/g.32059  ORF Transcript_20183/g.32059 Transcript_20183/m.32059 type:complete len:386 (+) Transcript_20183:33-1190(+)